MGPYKDLAGNAFWRTAVAEVDLSGLSGLWTPDFYLSKDDAIATYGSCFARNIGARCRASGLNWIEAERPPPSLTEANARRFGYGLFSSRTGNIFTASLLLQWIRWALQEEEPPKEVWELDGRYVDPFRPLIEPGGFDSAGEVLKSRAVAIECFRESLASANLLLFTAGLTESWWHCDGGYEYPMAPGIAGGCFDQGTHRFLNQGFEFVNDCLTAMLARLSDLNPDLRAVMTVSPVPLAATASGTHVLSASTYSKSVLRAAVGACAERFDNVCYFPAYELIASPISGGAFYSPDKRNVSPSGVDLVMSHFFRPFDIAPAAQSAAAVVGDLDEAECEEQILDAFRT